MEANREQADLAVERAGERERSGDIEGAIRLLQRASKLVPALDLGGRIAELERRIAEKENTDTARTDGPERSCGAAEETDNKSAEGDGEGEGDGIEPRFVEAVTRVLPIKGDYYLILGVPPSATLVEIQKSYRRLCLVLHPDKNPHRQAEEAFKALQAAYETLADASSRSTYDNRSNPAAARSRAPHGGFNNTQYKSPYGATPASRGVPCVPPRPVLKAVDDRSCVVEWMAVSDNGSPISKYQLYLLYEGLAMEFRVTGLSPASIYSFEVVALNARGASPHSPPLTVTTLQGKPLRPTVELTSVRGAHVKVRWMVHPFGCESTLSVDGKEVYVGTKWQWSGKLPRGTHSFVVVAENEFGASDPSEPLIVEVVGEAPAKPARLWCHPTTAADLFREQARAAPAPGAEAPPPPPAPSPASPPKHLYVLHVDGAEVFCGPALAFEARGLVPATKYTVSLRYRNEHGDSPPLTLKFLTEPALPGAPPAPTFVAADEKTVTVGLAPPADSGGSSVTSYKVRCEETGTCFLALGNASKYRFPGLRPGRPYSFRVAAVNARGAGPFSDPLAASTAGERDESEPAPAQAAGRLSGGSGSPPGAPREPVTIDLEADDDEGEAKGPAAAPVPRTPAPCRIPDPQSLPTPAPTPAASRAGASPPGKGQGTGAAAAAAGPGSASARGKGKRASLGAASAGSDKKQKLMTSFFTRTDG
eukprot:tig00000806_g4373.t1